MGETINFYGSLVALTGGLLFVVVYTAMPLITGRRRWWSSQLGRMFVTKSLAIIGLMIISVVYYTSGLDPEWVRGVRGVFSGLIGLVLAYQGWLVYKFQSREDD